MSKLSIFRHDLHKALSSIGQAFAHLMGVDVFIERGTDCMFSGKTNPAGDREWWGLGLHIVVSPIEMSAGKPVTRQGKVDLPTSSKRRN
jgi:hypothetical protein